MMFSTKMFFVLLTLSTLDATRGSNLRGKVRRKLPEETNDAPRSLRDDTVCQGHPVEITFQYNGGDCNQSDHLQVRQSCTDTRSGPPAAGSGAQSYITATSFGGSDIFFSGTVKVGEKYTLNEQETFDKLPAGIIITILDSQEGTPLQKMVVSLYCSQQWFLFDKFGSSQVTQWVDTSGRTNEDWIRHDTNAPTDNATNAPTNAPTDAPTNTPTNAPTTAPTNEEQEETIDETSDQEQRCRAFNNQECIGDFPVAAICSRGEQGCCPDGITLHWNGEPDICTTGISWQHPDLTSQVTTGTMKRDDPTFNYWDMDGRGCEWIRGKLDNPDYQDEDNNYSRSKCLNANNDKGGLCPSCEFNDVSNACPSVCA